MFCSHIFFLHRVANKRSSVPQWVKWIELPVIYTMINIDLMRIISDTAQGISQESPKFIPEILEILFHASFIARFQNWGLGPNFELIWELPTTCNGWVSIRFVFQCIRKTRTKRFIRSEAKSKLFLRTELYINKNEKEKN